MASMVAPDEFYDQRLHRNSSGHQKTLRLLASAAKTDACQLLNHHPRQARHLACIEGHVAGRGGYHMA
jgi:hypothetical protein